LHPGYLQKFIGDEQVEKFPENNIGTLLLIFYGQNRLCWYRLSV